MERSLIRVLFPTILAAGLMSAQVATNPNPSTNTGSSGGGGNSNGSNRNTQPQPQPRTPTSAIQTPVFVSGTVVMATGEQPSERAEIIRICAANSTRMIGYTDSHGHFNVQLNGQNGMASIDASDSLLPDTMQGMRTEISTSTSPMGTTDSFFDCELRARLAGYRSSSIILAGRKPLDSPDVGRLVLTRLSADDGQAISATSAGASKDARKSYDKGLSEARKRNFENADKQFRKAVELYPQYADAWMELGKIYVAQKRLPEAHDAFLKSIEADPRYVYPYEQLYLVEFEQQDWDSLAETTSRLLRLNPYEFPTAYYYNGVAYYQLKNWDAAEKSLLKAIDGDKRNTNPKSHYALGLVQLQKRNFVAAANAFSEFAAIAPNDPQVPKVRALIDELRQAQR